MPAAIETDMDPRDGLRISTITASAAAREAQKIDLVDVFERASLECYGQVQVLQISFTVSLERYRELYAAAPEAASIERVVAGNWVQLTKGPSASRGPLPRTFSNQLSFRVRLGDHNSHVKLFETGRILVTGARRVEDLPRINAAMGGLVGRPFDDLLVCMLNCGFSIGCPLRLYRLAEACAHEGVDACYEPSVYPAVKVVQTKDCGNNDSESKKTYKVVVSVFSTGSVLVMGARSLAEADDARRRLLAVLEDNPDVMAQTTTPDPKN